MPLPVSSAADGLGVADRGMTLMETMVVLGLLLLLGSLMGSFLFDLARSSSVAGVRSGLQSQALLHTDAMLATVRRTTLSGLDVRGDVSRTGFLATLLRTITSTGQRVWGQRMRGYYWEPASSILYQLDSPPHPLPASLAFSPNQPPELSPTQIDGMFSEGRPLSARVTLFEVGLSGLRLRLKIVLEQEVPRATRQRCEMVREAFVMSP